MHDEPDRPSTDSVARDPLKQALDELPRQLEPERDLWPGIRARLEPRSDTGSTGEPEDSAPTLRARSDASSGAEVIRGPWGGVMGTFLPRAAAALFFMALGSLLTWALAPPVGVPTADSSPRLAMAEDGASGGEDVEEPGAAGRDMLGLASSGGRSAGPSGSLLLVEADYLRAKEALWIEILAHREQLAPVTLEVVERNLAIIDRAIHDLRRALADDPGNPGLQRMLIDNHQRSLDLLRRLAKEA